MATRTSKLKRRADDGVELIAKERRRQKRAECYTAGHDDDYTEGELAIAAACYAVERTGRAVTRAADSYSDAWPWDTFHDKRKRHSRLRQLAIAGALIAAEIDRLLRLKLRQANRKIP